MKVKVIWLLLFVMTTIGASAKFVQEVELKDGTILVGYVYRQQPGKFIVFHADRSRNDSKSKYLQHGKDYTLQWNDIKCIRRSAESTASWCRDKVTLKNGTVYVGLIEEQDLTVSMKLKLEGSGKTVNINYGDLQLSEKVAATGNDLWTDREYTNRLKLTDNSIHEGLIVMQYRGQKSSDCYVELLHGSGFRERIYLPDIIEYVISIQ